VSMSQILRASVSAVIGDMIEVAYGWRRLDSIEPIDQRHAACIGGTLWLTRYAKRRRTVGWTDGFAEWEFVAREAARRVPFGCSGHEGPTTTPREYPMSPLRQRMIGDMTLAGLSPTTQAIYIKAVRGLAGHYRRSPDGLSEEEVRAYL